MSKIKLLVTGALFVGGESRRMGENKAFLKMGDKMLIERSLDVLNSVCEEVLISSRQSEGYQEFGYPVITDRIQGKGPLGGLYSILAESKHDHIFVVACDMPFLNEEGIRFLYQELEDFDSVVPKALGRLHPLHAFYHKRIFSLVERSILKDKLKLAEVLRGCRMKTVDIGYYPESLINVNTPNDWENALNKK